VKKACSHLDKHSQWLEDADAKSAQPWKGKMLTTTELNKSINGFDKKAMEESIMEELSKKFEVVSLANMSRRAQKGKDGYRCIWCDSLEDQRQECADLQEAIRRNVIYLDSNMICSNETGKPLRINFGRGGSKKLAEEEDARHVDAMHYAATVGIRVGRENLKSARTEIGF
jgi:hypothetical protein